MATALHITRSKSRKFRCDIAGCRNFTTLFVSKRQELSARPLHLCEECIRGLNRLLDETKGVREIVPPDQGVVDESDTMDWTAVDMEFPVKPVSEPEPEKPLKSKTESKPNRAKGGKSAPKGGKK